jgi:hypothetical protein
VSTAALAEVLASSRAACVFGEDVRGITPRKNVWQSLPLAGIVPLTPGAKGLVDAMIPGALLPIQPVAETIRKNTAMNRPTTLFIFNNFLLLALGL